MIGMGFNALKSFPLLKTNKFHVGGIFTYLIDVDIFLTVMETISSNSLLIRISFLSLVVYKKATKTLRTI